MKYLLLVLLLFSFLYIFQTVVKAASNTSTIWNMQCIDTMKTSRDKAREWMHTPSANLFIDAQVKFIKQSGATCIAIDTPYDPEFIPILSIWVSTARKYELSVWFRGNFSSWEGWFDYPKFTNPSDHHKKTYDFIIKNKNLFRNGDMFTPIPEAENGMIGDPRKTGKRKEFNQFLIASYGNCNKAFYAIGKDIHCGYFSMNGDVANEILTKDTVKKIGNVVVIDHYVPTAMQMEHDIVALAKKFDAKIVLGEFGAPIPDVNGNMSEEETKLFLDQLFSVFYKHKDTIAGLNYWTLYGGSTALLTETYLPKSPFSLIEKYYAPGKISGKVVNTINKNLSDVPIEANGEKVAFTKDGIFSAVLPQGSYTISIPSSNYVAKPITISLGKNTEKQLLFMVDTKKKTWWENVQIAFFSFFENVKPVETNLF